MPILYEAFQSTLANKENKKLYYPRVVTVGNVNSDLLAEEVARYSSLTTGDVKNAIDNLVMVMATHLQASESVTLNGFGTFSIRMSSSGKGVETADEVSAAQAQLKVRFLPASTRNADRTLATRSFVTGAKCKRFDRATGEMGTEEELPGGTGSGDNDDEEVGGGI